MPDATTQSMPTKTELENTLVHVTKRFHLGLWITHAGYALFLILLVLSNILSAQPNIKIVLIKIFPLLIFIPAFIKQYPRTYSWLCFAVLPYFIFITPYLFEKFSLITWIEILLTVTIFIASMMTSRWLQQKSYLTWQIANTPSH